MALDWRLRLLLSFDRADPNPEAPIARARFEALTQALRVVATGSGPSMADEQTLSIPVSGATIAARLYRPTAGRLPIVVHFHGGGWVVGSLSTHQPFCRALAQATGAMVLDVDYRLAPEHPFPTPLDDCLAAFRWATANASHFEGDGDRLALVGDSAGGNLAICTALRARDEGGPVPKALALTYPIADADFTTESYRRFHEGYGLNTSRMRWYWEQYLADETARAAPTASPLRADLRGLPPTLVITAEHDVLHDEGVALAVKLRESAVTTTALDVRGVIHGFAVMQRLLPQARACLSDISGHLRSALWV